MAAKSIMCSFFLLVISSIPQSFAQSSSSPQNIQVFYPSYTPPPPQPIFRPLPAPTINPTSPTSNRPLPAGKSSTKSAVGTAIGVTAAGTLAVSGLLFFFILRNSKRKRDREIVTAMAADVGSNRRAGGPQTDHFTRLSGNLKGVIVDENGLDVLYWRNLEAGEKVSGFKTQYYRRSLGDSQKEEETGSVDSSGRKEDPLQELPLLKGRPSTSQSTIWGQKNDQRIKNAPTVTSDKSFKDEGNQDSSIGAVKNSTPPLPPPPPMKSSYGSSAVPNGKPAAPPLPPPPGAAPVRSLFTLASGSVPKGKMPAPPPPSPMVSSNRSRAPPPPLPPAPNAGMPSQNGMASKPSSSGEEGQVKMKPFHWEKVNPDVKHSMAWDKMDRGSFQFDGDLMEALFGYVATSRNSPRGDGSLVNANKSGPPQIFIFDARKSQNIAIVIKSLGITRKDLINALLEGQGLNTDAVEKLTKIAPNAEELSKILAFCGDPTKLADAESFLYHLLKAVPSAFTRFDALLFKFNFDTEVSHVKETLHSLESACTELKTRGLFLKLLEAVLKAGNRLNAGTSRGNAQAFNLTALTKLSDVKSSDGKTTLLQFVVQEVVRAEGKRFVLNKNKAKSQSINGTDQSQKDDKFLSKDDREREYMMLGLPVVGGLSAEFSNVKKAATLDHDLLIKTSSALSSQLEKTRESVEQCGNEGGFTREMIGFLDTAELELQIVKEEQTRVIELVKKTTDYYHTGFSSKERGKNTFQLFVIVGDFLGMVDQVCVDIARNVQKRKPVSSLPSSSVSTSANGSSPPESPRVFRFPKLPVNFMSEHSRNGSMDRDNDS